MEAVVHQRNHEAYEHGCPDEVGSHRHLESVGSGAEVTAHYPGVIKKVFRFQFLLFNNVAEVSH